MTKNIDKKLVKAKKLGAQLQLHQELLNTKDTYPKKFGNIFKKMRENKTTKTNNMAVDPNSLLTHFRVLQECATDDNLETRENCASYVPVLDKEITEEEWQSTI